MAMSFMQAAGRPVQNVQQYLEESAASPLKYTGTSGEVAKVFFPYTTMTTQDENGNQIESKSLLSYELRTHDIKQNAKSYELCACLKLSDPLLDDDGNVINSGTCPFCERQPDAQAIMDFRMEAEKAKLTAQGMFGEQLEKRIETVQSQLRSELKISYAKPRLYILVAKFKRNSKGEEELETVTDANGNKVMMPIYELKIMRISKKQLEGYQKAFDQMKAMGIDATMAGGELVITYGTSNNARDVIGKASCSATYPQVMLVNKYPGLLEKIENDAMNFNWNDIVGAYPEFKGMSDADAIKKVDKALKLWDEYQAALASGNNNAVYAEYGVSQVTYPELKDSRGVGPTPQLPNMQGALPTMNNDQAVQMPGQNGQQAGNVQAGNMGNMGVGFTPNMNAPTNFGQAPATGDANSFGAGQQGLPWNNFGGGVN